MSDPITLYVVSDHGFVQPRIEITPEQLQAIVRAGSGEIMARLEKLEKAYACTEPDTLEILSSIEEQVRALAISYQNHLTGYHGPVVTAAPQPTEQPDQKRVVVKMPPIWGKINGVPVVCEKYVINAIREAGGEVEEVEYA